MTRSAPLFALSRRDVLSLVIASALAPAALDRAHAETTDAEARLRALLEASEAAQNRLDPLAAARRGQIGRAHV